MIYWNTLDLIGLAIILAVIVGGVIFLLGLWIVGLIIERKK